MVVVVGGDGVMVVDRGSRARKGYDTCTAPATKSALQDAQRTAPGTCNEICTSRSTKHCAGHEMRTSSSTKYCTCHQKCTSRSTKYCTCHEICTSRSTKYTAPATTCALQGPQSTAPGTISQNEPRHMSKTHDSPHLPRNQSMPKTTAMSKVLRLRLKFYTSTSKCCDLLHLSQKVDFRPHQNTRFPLRLPRKVITKSKNAHGTTRRERTSVKHRPAASVSRDPTQRYCIGHLRTELSCEPAQPKRAGTKSVP